MGSVFDLNITNIEKAKFSGRLLGTAHELIATGVIMRLGFDVSVSSVKGGAYDLLITAYKNGPQSTEAIIRAQIKTCEDSISFIGGVRGGIDREYISGVKEYKYSEKDNDLIIGVDRTNLDMYLIPTRYLKEFGKSKSVKQLQPLKNNWDILLNWRDDYLNNLLEKIRV